MTAKISANGLGSQGLFLCLPSGIAGIRTYTDHQREEPPLTSIVFAAVVATVLLLTFDRTRGFGVIGVFALIALQPWVFTPFFALTGAALIHFKRKGTI